AGAGANSINSISGTTAAYMEESSILNSGSVSLNSENQSGISANVFAVSVSGGGGKGGGVGVSIGAAVSENQIGSESNRLTVSSYLKNTAVNSTGKLSLSALADMDVT
ncbi:hypothetical protein, partial [Vibrio genomosp. F10]|uniref:hypothetical protein n=1 Tax=Vibrio genomosp. F10 TaxID=723171 RepID=UPI0013018D37